MDPWEIAGVSHSTEQYFHSACRLLGLVDRPAPRAPPALVHAVLLGFPGRSSIWHLLFSPEHIPISLCSPLCGMRDLNKKLPKVSSKYFEDKLLYFSVMQMC